MPLLPAKGDPESSDINIRVSMEMLLWFQQQNSDSETEPIWPSPQRGGAEDPEGPAAHRAGWRH